MVNEAPNRCTISPQPHEPGSCDLAAPQALSGLGSGGPVIYAWAPAGPDAKERLVQRLLANLRPEGGLAAGDPGNNRSGPTAPEV
jgi:hypothetical protein